MKKIEVAEVEVGNLKTDFGNPRKIDAKGKKRLQKSLEQLGDFGLILIDEEDNVIAGNQRVSILKEKDPKTKVLCKKLIGYSQGELRTINVEDNIHEGQWDLDMLNEWKVDLVLDNVDLRNDTFNPFERKIDEMELVHYEKYDYVIIACRNEIDYNTLTRKLCIDDKKVQITSKRKINARAIWYEDIKGQIIGAENEK